MASPMDIILDMIILVFSNTSGTLASLFNLFGSLVQSLAAISGTGSLGFFLAVLVLGGAVYFLGRFFIASWKMLALLFVAGLAVIWILMAGAGF